VARSVEIATRPAPPAGGLPHPPVRPPDHDSPPQRGPGHR
jgi:hypothetical protein